MCTYNQCNMMRGEFGAPSILPRGGGLAASGLPDLIDRRLSFELQSTRQGDES